MKRRSGVVACSFLPVYKILLLKIDTFKLEIDTLQEAIELSTAEKGFNYCSAAWNHKKYVCITTSVSHGTLKNLTKEEDTSDMRLSHFWFPEFIRDY